MVGNAITEKDLEIFRAGDNNAIYRGGARFADAISFGAEEVNQDLLQEFSKVRGKKVIKYNDNNLVLDEYLELYNKLSEH